MSGTGKSSLIRLLAKRGYKAVDLDSDQWSEWVPLSGDESPLPADPSTVWETHDWVWREDRVQELLSADDTDILFISGTAANQGRFLRQIDHIILLTAPPATLAERLTTRTNNPYGKHPVELARVLEQVRTVEPLLRRAATAEVETTAPLDEVLRIVLDIVKAEA
jgi:shikimate kinase